MYEDLLEEARLLRDDLFTWVVVFIINTSTS